MSREAYRAPTQIQEPTTQSSSTAQYGYSVSGGDRGTPYRCGDCNAQNIVKRGDPVRCKGMLLSFSLDASRGRGVVDVWTWKGKLTRCCAECGYRVLYKERTNRIVQFEAR